MKPELQRIAIAEACGITVGACTCTDNPYIDVATRKHIPDYLNDLDAMHEAEKVLNEKQELRYLTQLMLVIDDNSSLGWRKHVCYRATASQRAEAFLKTLNLWKP